MAEPRRTASTATSVQPTTRVAISRNTSRANTRATTDRDLESGVDSGNGNGAAREAHEPDADTLSHPNHPHLGDSGSISRTKAFWARLNGQGKRHVPGWAESANNTLRHSCEFRRDHFTPDSDLVPLRAHCVRILYTFFMGIALGALALPNNFFM